MQAPEFWRHDGLPARLLTPLGLAYHGAGVLRRALTTPWRAPVPVICVGNLVAGGAGKTPVVLSLLKLLADRGLKPMALTRGYGGKVVGPLRVDPARHDAAKVGDEALLLNVAAPTWVARDRVDGAREAVEEGAGALVMDDGFQNPGLKKDLSFLVVDAAYGFGNGRVMPAGPLRETVASGLARAHAVVLLGDGALDRTLFGSLPVLRARLKPLDSGLTGQRVFAFAGIGRPEKFFDTLRNLGAEIAGSEAFPDHKPYSPDTLARLRRAADAAKARLVTTDKDAMRLGPLLSPDIAIQYVELVWESETELLALLDRLVLSRGGVA